LFPVVMQMNSTVKGIW